MGTSTWHRSPETEAWRRVRELYARPDPSPAEVVSRIVAALDPATRVGMSDPAVATCLGTVVEAPQLVGRQGLGATLDALGVGREPAAVQLAAGLRSRAEMLIAREGYASRFGDLSLEAVGTSALALAALSGDDAGILSLTSEAVECSLAQYEHDRGLAEAASLFVGHDLDRTFRYFVARDLGDFIGGEGLPTVSHANRFEDAVAAHCRDTWRALSLAEFEPRLSTVVDVSPARRPELLGPVMAAGIEQGLALLAAGGL